MKVYTKIDLASTIFCVCFRRVLCEFEYCVSLSILHHPEAAGKGSAGPRL